jgi:hypothetical protein
MFVCTGLQHTPYLELWVYSVPWFWRWLLSIFVLAMLQLNLRGFCLMLSAVWRWYHLLQI